MPPKVADQLAADPNSAVREALASNVSAPVAVLRDLAHDADPAVAVKAFANPSAPADTVNALAPSLLTFGDAVYLPTVLEALSRNAVDLPGQLVEDALDRLSHSYLPGCDAERIVAHDARTSSRTLQRLAKSPRDDIRAAVAAHSATPAPLLTALAADATGCVRRAAAGNARCDADVLAALLTDDDWSVKNAAAANPSLRQADREAFDALRAEHVVTRDELERLAAHRHADMRMRVPRYYREAPADILALLAGERRSVHVRRAVAGHPNTPPIALTTLADLNDPDIDMSISYHAATAPDVRLAMAARSLDCAIMVILNPDIELWVLDALGGDADALVRYFATKAREARTEAAQLPRAAAPQALSA